MNVGDKIVLDGGEITGEVVAVTGSTHTIRWATGEVFTYTNDLDWTEDE